MKIKKLPKTIINFIDTKPTATLVIAVLLIASSVLIVKAALTISASSVTSDGSLSLTAGGTNQNVTITPSGSGYTVLNGNVGIGTAAPNAALDVNGYALFSESFGSLAEDTLGLTTGSVITATLAGTFYGWKGATSTISTQTGVGYVTYSIGSGATSTLTIGANGGGTYFIAFNANVKVNTTSEVIHCVAFKNGVMLNNVSGETNLTNAADNAEIFGGPAYIALVAGDVLDLRCADESSAGRTITFQHVGFGIHRVGR